MKSVSVVIPTLGGDVLNETIECLNQGTLIPSEIIVCIPKAEAYKVGRMTFNNLKILVTEERGQVAQRAAGFHEAKEDLVLQLDDDILLADDALELMTREISDLGPLNVLGPVFYGDTDFSYCMHRLPRGFSGFLRNLEASLFCLAPWGKKRMGCITKTGMAYGFDDEYLDSAPQKTDWLPGGCVLSFKQDLILERFYPFVGKAYNEDLIHSVLRQNLNINHWITSKAKCCTEPFWGNRDFMNLSNDIKSGRYIMELRTGKNPVFFSWAAFEHFKAFLKKFIDWPSLKSTK